MKITLDASIKEHREVAELFRNQPCIFKRSISGEPTGGAFVSTMDSPHYPKFVVYRLGDVTTKESVTIDLSTAKMDLRMALGTRIKFKLPHYKTSRILRTAKFDEDGKVFNFNQFFGTEAKKIKLCPDYLKRIGVEVEE